MTQTSSDQQGFLREIDFTPLQKFLFSGMIALLLASVFFLAAVLSLHNLLGAVCFSVPFALLAVAISPGIAWWLMQKLEKPVARLPLKFAVDE